MGIFLKFHLTKDTKARREDEKITKYAQSFSLCLGVLCEMSFEVNFLKFTRLRERKHEL
jgi:hypothetical protein